jgi:hypothetical protein
MSTIKQRFEDEVRALAQRYQNGKYAGQSVWFPTQFDALDNELRQPNPDLGLVASVIVTIETALDRLAVSTLIVSYLL